MKKVQSLRKTETLFPPDFIERLSSIIPSSKYQEVLASFTIKRPTTLRANTLKIKGFELRKRLADKSILINPVPWSKEAFILAKITLRDLEKTSEYLEGFIYVQSLSSMIPAIVLAPKPGEKVLDIAAAPGSKTTQMASMMQNTGEILANDSSPIRVLKLKANLERQSATIVTVDQKPGERMWMEYPEYFDKVLVDVPCSMEGRFSLVERDSTKRWSLKNIGRLSHEQKYILRSAISSAKVGATIVYSTCTLAPEENEEVIDWILEKEKGKIIVEPISLPQLNTTTALSTWKGRTYKKEVEKTVRILPNREMEGFYIAKLKKIAGTVPQNMIA